MKFEALHFILEAAGRGLFFGPVSHSSENQTGDDGSAARASYSAAQHQYEHPAPPLPLRSAHKALANTCSPTTARGAAALPSAG